MHRSNRKGDILVGDIGGTKTKLGCFTGRGNSPVFHRLETYDSEKADSFSNILEHYLEKHRIDVEGACFGIAGPVLDGRCSATNLPWEVSESGLRQKFGWRRVSLINDLAAAAVAIPVLDPDDFISLTPGRPAAPDGTIALIAPGTGLGQALLIRCGDRWQPVPSEGGHADFAPTTEQESRLWRHLHDKLGHVSIERVVSGPGLMNIYSWMRDAHHHREPEWLNNQMENSDPPAVITRAALEGRDPVCEKTLELFVSILGAVAGNLALTASARGGVYLGGGIPPKILPAIRNGTFLDSFAGKGRFETFLREIPVHVVLNDKAPLIGAAESFERLAG